ncbi:ABC transporter ATP-binding protein [Thermoanaerobacterium thermosaccharolyticum]|jgi:ABC-2 type transport system ATP-binding protein|uniref:ABC transporter related n=1 Tax=Thermoanaerobacterium thermosaccharolyticum (strain ATCC 7956 / DSM 571 / NCIMB 9385 / NCA 3814 / NCTC 13789 / WDCM 00135 / 2032) TaxID=580327 RepID=D9TNE1_THETC|nr:ABC transporter ATP-binding protein [Thermoanaerobacterium thermosaccharolyticum]MDK2829717.1 type transport system ATP-binding protein [Clostridium butyricum]MDN5317478.1 type transport system ATP-binding protein [Thermoanaerobacterium sp.]ADL67684.1 ABC transporter related [Thermoanaerobacterium thermosaccharolyticum DSM 571]MBE0067542.1 ABC transporter ATP-binding protein [Thermoanaerobacterium thermosaccharolyticum]MBE0227074.1 ABC transporter ATP-binding protein [Thermoanaerobacterium 
MGLILKTANLTKNYYSKKALKGINIELEEGKILGLLGPNGSGKTTFIKIAAGILRPTSGEILIDGQEPGIYTKLIVSYLPDINYLYKWMKIRDAINFFKDFYDDFDIEKSKRLLDFMMLDENDKVTSLSKGMLEKLNLTLVLSRNAKLYIFDEPLGGIDPNTREKIIDAIIDNIREDSSMIISTHLVRDIERLFDDVAFISDGEIILKGNAEELRMERNKSIDEIFREVYE